MFTDHAPKPKNLKAVKLTEANIHELGKLIAEKADAVVVEVDIASGLLSFDSYSFELGEWIVEEYDYREERVVFRVARSDEREKYDLR